MSTPYGRSPDVLRRARLELHLELVGAEPDGAEHTDPAGVGDGRGDVAAMGEGEDREFDPETLAELVVHRDFLRFRRTAGVRPADY